MFENLVDKFSTIFKKLRSKGRLSPQEVENILKELRMILLESDVHYKVARELINRVKERAIGKEVMESVTPGEMVIKILWDEIRKCLGEETRNLNLSTLPSFLLLVGLQGSGKTTTCAKLALRLKKQGYFPLLVSTDTRRPAAKEQLKTLAQNAQIDFFDEPRVLSPLEMVKKARAFARQKSNDVVIVDTAGRLHVEETLLAELKELVEGESFQEIFLVLDATTGQEAVKVAKSFEEWVKPTSIILTKVDTDARGGAVLSIVSQTGWPVKLVGTGEKLEQIEVFHPDRMASRILGLGDTLTLIEKIEKAIEKESEKKFTQKLKKEEITLIDFLEEIKRLRSVSSFEEMVGMLPASLRSNLSKIDGDKSLKRVEAIIHSMTLQERLNPSIINASRKKRIALGSGTSIQEVNRLLKQFEEFKKLWKQIHKSKFSSLPKRGLFGWKI